ncbi:MAG: hypothetical protein WB760_05480, partial [Xanthobacteraceae bacterium]
MIIVTRELYDESDRDSRPHRMAFMLRFPSGTGCWSHNTANVAARINEYRAAAKHPVDVSWRIADVACPVQVDGTKPSGMGMGALTLAKTIADDPDSHSIDQMRGALEYLERTRSNGGVRNSDRAIVQLERRLARLTDAIARAQVVE